MSRVGKSYIQILKPTFLHGGARSGAACRNVTQSIFRLGAMPNLFTLRDSTDPYPESGDACRRMSAVLVGRVLRVCKWAREGQTLGDGQTWTDIQLWRDGADRRDTWTGAGGQTGRTVMGSGRDGMDGRTALTRAMSTVFEL